MYDIGCIRWRYLWPSAAVWRQIWVIIGSGNGLSADQPAASSYDWTKDIWSAIAFCDNHLRPVSHEMLKTSIRKMCWKKTHNIKIRFTSARGQWVGTRGRGTVFIWWQKFFYRVVPKSNVLVIFFFGVRTWGAPVYPNRLLYRALKME